MLGERWLRRGASALFAGFYLSVAALLLSCSRTALGLPPVPRLIGPPSTSMVISRRPTFRWTLDGGDTPVVVEICADRPCARVITRIAASGRSAVPADDLPPGVVYWRVRASREDEVGISRTWQVTIPAKSAPTSTSWGTVLDLDGDGLADLAVLDMAGGIVVHRGGLAGLSRPSDVIMLPSGSQGATLANAGDVDGDGDGYGDLLVGTCAQEPGGSGGLLGPPCDPVVYVYRGGPSGPEDAPSVTLADPRDMDFGARVMAAAGDVNGDGYGDVLLGATCSASSASCILGRARLYLGGPGGLATTPAAVHAASPTPETSADMGMSFAPAADLNGDGYADLVVAARGAGPTTSRVYTFEGGPLGLSDARTVPPASLEAEGLDVVVLGDADGDGYVDLAFAPGVSCSDPAMGCVSIHGVDVHGPRLQPWTTVESPAGAPPSPFPTATSDVDGDGRADVLLLNVGYGDLTYAFQAHVYPGGTSGFLASQGIGLEASPGKPWFSGRPDVGVGSVTGDVDGDGFADVAIVQQEYAPRIYLFRGGAGGVVPTPVIIDP